MTNYFANKFEVWFTPFYFVSAVVMGANQEIDSPYAIEKLFTAQTSIIFFAIVGGIILLFLLAYILAKPLFFKIAVKPFEYNKKVIFHNFARSRQRVKSYSYGDAFAPVLDKQYKGKELVSLRAKF